MMTDAGEARDEHPHECATDDRGSPTWGASAQYAQEIHRLLSKVWLTVLSLVEAWLFNSRALSTECECR